jgi:hypothetical protein
MFKLAYMRRRDNYAPLWLKDQCTWLVDDCEEVLYDLWADDGGKSSDVLKNYLCWGKGV